MNPSHKILEKFPIVSLVVYFIGCVLSALCRLILRVCSNHRRNLDSIALSVNSTKIRILGILG